MNWRSLLLMPALLVLIAHSLIAHEHSNNGAIIPEFANAASSGVSLLTCFISSDIGEEHLESYQVGNSTPEISFSEGSVVPFICSNPITPGSWAPNSSGQSFFTNQSWYTPDKHITSSLSRRGPPVV